MRIGRVGGAKLKSVASISPRGPASVRPPARPPVYTQHLFPFFRLAFRPDRARAFSTRRLKRVTAGAEGPAFGPSIVLSYFAVSARGGR